MAVFLPAPITMSEGGGRSKLNHHHKILAATFLLCTDSASLTSVTLSEIMSNHGGTRILAIVPAHEKKERLENALDLKKKVL